MRDHVRYAVVAEGSDRVSVPRDPRRGARAAWPDIAPDPQVLRGQALVARADQGPGAGHPGAPGTGARPAVRDVADHGPPGPRRARGGRPAAAPAGPGDVRGQA